MILISKSQSLKPMIKNFVKWTWLIQTNRNLSENEEFVFLREQTELFPKWKTQREVSQKSIFWTQPSSRAEHHVLLKLIHANWISDEAIHIYDGSKACWSQRAFGNCTCLVCCMAKMFAQLFRFCQNLKFSWKIGFIWYMSDFFGNFGQFLNIATNND